MSKNKSITKSWKNSFEVLEELGKGGNGKVYRVRKNDTGETYALKQLESNTTEKKARFLSEIRVVMHNTPELKGVLPIIEYSSEEFWYTMPIATPIMEHFQEGTTGIGDVIQAVLQLAETLEQLHKKGISHRDIKPSNIYYLDGRYCLADFGLANYPENLDRFTRSDKGLGAIFTISPEMKRDPKHADGKKADVFSLAKTVWMLFTGNERGFDGVYQFQDKSHALRHQSKFGNMHLVELETLLTVATQNNPVDRPTMGEFRERFIDWKRIVDDYDESQRSEWAFLKRHLFGTGSPETASWSEPSRIINILNIIGAVPACNHMMLPGGGGMDLKSAEQATEAGCIYLYDDCGGCHLICPHRLHYVAFSDDTIWSYFFLELKELSPVLSKTDLCYEPLVEDKPGHYVSARYVQYGVYDYDTGEPLPDGYRFVSRYNSGNILIVFKSGPYNGISATYDGRHSTVDFRVFSDYMESLRKSYCHLLDKGISPDQFLSAPEFSRNPFINAEQEEDFEQEYIPAKPARVYIEKTYLQWDFSDFLVCEKTSGNAAFYIELQIDTHDIFSVLSQEFTVLCIDGHFHAVQKAEIATLAFLLYDRDECYALLNRCEQKLVELCTNQGVTLPEHETYFHVKIQRLSIPEHLFTLEEIKSLMQNADDRVSNMLVIDENGYPNILSDFRQASSYPVRLDSWDAGNCYVGKYSRLLSLKDNYQQALEGWCDYLKYGKSVHKDFVSGESTLEELCSQIYEIQRKESST